MRDQNRCVDSRRGRYGRTNSPAHSGGDCYSLRSSVASLVSGLLPTTVGTACVPGNIRHGSSPPLANTCMMILRRWYYNPNIQVWHSSKYVHTAFLGMWRFRPERAGMYRLCRSTKISRGGASRVSGTNAAISCCRAGRNADLKRIAYRLHPKGTTPSTDSCRYHSASSSQ